MKNARENNSVIQLFDNYEMCGNILDVMNTLSELENTYNMKRLELEILRLEKELASFKTKKPAATLVTQSTKKYMTEEGFTNLKNLIYSHIQKNRKVSGKKIHKNFCKNDEYTSHYIDKALRSLLQESRIIRLTNTFTYTTLSPQKEFEFSKPHVVIDYPKKSSKRNKIHKLSKNEKFDLTDLVFEVIIKSKTGITASNLYKSFVTMNPKYTETNVRTALRELEKIKGITRKGQSIGTYYIKQ